MSAIKSEDGHILLNLENVDAVVVERPLAGGDKYNIVAYTSSGAVWYIASGTKEQMQERTAHLERWLASGAQGVFQV